MKLPGIKECGDNNVQSIAINHLDASVPHVRDKLEDVVHNVHCTGK